MEVRYCADDPEADIERLEELDCDPSLAAWAEDCESSDALLNLSELDAVAPGNGPTVRWNVFKLLGEYARHAGHANLLRERIDGTTGE